MDSPIDDQTTGAALPVPTDEPATPTATPPASPLTEAAAPLPTAAVQDEDDVIDKAWIAKAQEIIAATDGDPHKQSQQLAALKTEYLQKRYNKTITAGN